MCIVALAWQLFDGYPVVLLSNRDEFFDRPTLDAHQWLDKPIFAARDQQSNGTWLGYHQQPSATQPKTQNGRWATVLNYRDGTKLDSSQTSRGQLVSDFLSSSLSPMDFAKQINLTQYAGFNLLLGTHQQAVLVNNRGYQPTALSAGLYVISNGCPTQPWFKTERLRKKIYQELLPLIEQKIPEKDWHDIAFSIMQDATQAPYDQLPDTGMPTAIEHLLSSIFIPSQNLGTQGNYGTRTISLLTQTSNHQNTLKTNNIK